MFHKLFSPPPVVRSFCFNLLHSKVKEINERKEKLVHERVARDLFGSSKWVERSMCVYAKGGVKLLLIWHNIVGRNQTNKL
jgi:hypothetical protein